MSNITGKVVVITGASSGIGESTAKLLAEHGAKLYLERGVRTESTQWFKRSRLTAARLSDLLPM
jgi:NADP-dependent 3-hydroxy acid dehydrogenase YdfG